MKLVFNEGITRNGNNFTIGSNGRLDVHLDSTDQDFTLEFELQTTLVDRWNSPVGIVGPSTNYNIQNAGYTAYNCVYWDGNRTNITAYTTSKKAYYLIKKEGANLSLFLRLETGETYTFNAECLQDVTSIQIGNWQQENRVTGSITNLNFLNHKFKKYYFKADFQNTLKPQVGTFSNEENKTGLFTQEGGEYYLTNNTNNSYRWYGCSESTQEKSHTIEFDLYYPNPGSGFKWVFLCAGDDPTSWWGIATRTNLVIATSDYGETTLVSKTNTWLHIKIVTTFKAGTYERLIYIDDVLVTAVTFASKYFITKMNILGNESGYKSDARLKNLVIYSEESEHRYLDKEGLKQVWKNIKDYHEASLSNYYTKEEVDALINSILTANTSANSAEDIE